MIFTHTYTQTHTIKHIFTYYGCGNWYLKKLDYFLRLYILRVRGHVQVLFPIYLPLYLNSNLFLHARSISPWIIQFGGQKQWVTDSGKNFPGPLYSVPGPGFISYSYCIVYPITTIFILTIHFYPLNSNIFYFLILAWLVLNHRTLV